MTIREVVEQHALKRKEQRENNDKNINKLSWVAVLPGMIIYLVGTILAVIIRIYVRG